MILIATAIATTKKRNSIIQMKYICFIPMIAITTILIQYTQATKITISLRTIMLLVINFKIILLKDILTLVFLLGVLKK